MQTQKRTRVKHDYYNLSENYFSATLGGDWRAFKEVKLKTRFVPGRGGQWKVSLFVDGHEYGGGWTQIEPKHIVFENPTELEKCATYLLALSSLMVCPNLEREQLKLILARVFKNLVRTYDVGKKELAKFKKKHQELKNTAQATLSEY